MWDALWYGGKLATMTGTSPFGLHVHGVIAVEAGRVAWVGPEAALPAAPASLAREIHDLAGRLLTPGLVDPHNHAVYYGDSLIARARYRSPATQRWRSVAPLPTGRDA